MNNFILFLHLLGLMIGSAGGLASGILMRRALAMPADEARTVRSLGPMLAHVAGVGLVLMWVTGLIMVWSRWDGLGSLPSLFWVKFAFVLILTVASASIDVTYAQIRRTGNLALAKRLPVLGPISGIAATLAVLFAVFAFGQRGVVLRPACEWDLRRGRAIGQNDDIPTGSGRCVLPVFGHEAEMIACDRHILTASALAGGGGILPGPALLLRLDLALRRP